MSCIDLRSHGECCDRWVGRPRSRTTLSLPTLEEGASLALEDVRKFGGDPVNVNVIHAILVVVVALPVAKAAGEAQRHHVFLESCYRNMVNQH